MQIYKQNPKFRGEKKKKKVLPQTKGSYDTFLIKLQCNKPWNELFNTFLNIEQNEIVGNKM